MKEIQVKRVYDPPEAGDGQRVLVDRLWPRGLSKEKAGIHLWVRDLAPSNELRKWYQHDSAKWETFRARYFAELDRQPEAVTELIEASKGSVITLLFSSRELELNNAVALRDYLLGKTNEH